MNLNSYSAKLRNFNNELQKLVDEISIQNNANYLMDPITELWNQFDRNILRIDILYVSKTKTLEELKNWIPEISEDDFDSFTKDGFVEFSQNDVSFRIYDEDHFPIKSSNSLPVLIKLLICEELGYEEEDVLYFSQRFAKESVLLLCKCTNIDLLKAIRSETVKYTWKIHKLEKDNWNDHFHQLGETKDLINLISLTLSFKKIAEAINSTIDNENKDLSARKISVQNDHMKLKKQSNLRVGQELFSSLKINLQRSFNEFENGINQRFNDLTKNQPGSLYSYILDEIDSIHDLEEVKSNGGTKYTLSKKALKELELKARGGFEEHLTHDVISLNDYLKITVEEIEDSFKNNGLQGFNYSVKGVSKSDMISSIDEEFHFDKQHDSKAIKKGFMAVLSTARQPYMILIMTIGMLSSIPSLTGLRQKIWPLLILTLLVGIFFAIRGLKKKKIEEKSEELKKVSVWLKSEYKRIFSNIEKEWKTKYFKSAKDEFAEILIRTEEDLRMFQNTRIENISQDTNLIQRKIQTLEVFDKKIKETKKRKSQLETDMQALNSELKQLFIKQEI
jgi:hypothetical protein